MRIRLTIDLDDSDEEPEATAAAIMHRIAAWVDGPDVVFYPGADFDLSLSEPAELTVR